MSWRLFLNLVNNLSFDGAVAMQIKIADEKPETNDMDDEAAANAFFASVVSI